MGQATPEKTDRNKYIYEDWKSGKYSTIELIKKYELTPARIYQIINRHEAKLGLDKSIE